MVFTYFKTGRVMALNFETISFFCLLHLLEVSALRMLTVHFALVMVTFMYFFMTNYLLCYESLRVSMTYKDVSVDDLKPTSFLLGIPKLERFTDTDETKCSSQEKTL